MDFTYSASAISTKRLCFQKWWWTYVSGLPKAPPGPGAALGGEIHKQLENWLTKKEVPVHARAKALLPMLPIPSPLLKVEHAFRLILGPGIARGFIDVLITDPSAVKMPADFPKVKGPIVIDHKTTADLKWAKSDVDLLTDPQAILYGIEARLQVAKKIADVPEVGLAWQYTTTKGKAGTKRVFLKQTLPILENGLELVLNDAHEMQKAHASKVEDLSFDRKACDAFGGCPFRSNCKAYANTPAPSMLDALDETETTTMTNALERIKALNAANKSAAPVGDVKPSPEPKLEAFDTSKVADAPAAVNPPDAASNLTAETAPKATEESAMKKKPKTSKGKEVDPETIDDLLEMAIRKALKEDRIEHACSLLFARSDLNNIHA